MLLAELDNALLEIKPVDHTQYELKVTVTPTGVTSNYNVVVEDQDLQLTSVTIAYAIQAGGVIRRSLGGTDVFLPVGFTGQPISGDSSLSNAQLPPLEGNEGYVAILSGAVTNKNTGDLENFLDYKEFTK